MVVVEKREGRTRQKTVSTMANQYNMSGREVLSAGRDGGEEDGDSEGGRMHTESTAAARDLALKILPNLPCPKRHNS